MQFVYDEWFHQNQLKLAVSFMVFEAVFWDKRFSGFQGRFLGKEKLKKNKKTKVIIKVIQQTSLFRYNFIVIISFYFVIFSIFLCQIQKNLSRNCIIRLEHIYYGVTRSKTKKSDRSNCGINVWSRSRHKCRTDIWVRMEDGRL